GGVRERLAILDLVRTRRLTDQHHARIRHGTRERKSETLRARAGGVKQIEMLLKRRHGLTVNDEPCTILPMQRVIGFIIVAAVASTAPAWTAPSDQRIATNTRTP